MNNIFLNYGKERKKKLWQGEGKKIIYMVSQELCVWFSTMFLHPSIGTTPSPARL